MEYRKATEDEDDIVVAAMWDSYGMPPGLPNRDESVLGASLAVEQLLGS